MVNGPNTLCYCLAYCPSLGYFTHFHSNNIKCFLDYVYYILSIYLYISMFLMFRCLKINSIFLGGWFESIGFKLFLMGGKK